MQAITFRVRAADRLIELGIPGHGGLKWMIEPTFARLMPNFSHGTAGIAYGLARVYSVAVPPPGINPSAATPEG